MAGPTPRELAARFRKAGVEAIAKSAASERAALKMEMILRSPYIPVAPTPKQVMALLDPRFELLYGGSVGGGKSALLLMEALAFMCLPHAASLILRRELPMLEMEGGLIELAHEWLDHTDATWSEQKKRWSFPRGGRLQFGYLDEKKHLARYQGAAYQSVGYDELTQWKDKAFYTYLITRMRRRRASAIPLRLRATTNPDGPGMEWVREYFIDTEDPERGYLFASIYDNPYLDHAQYVANMRRTLDEASVRRLVDGDWNARPPGELFRREMFSPIHDALPDGVVIEVAVRGWDFAAADTAASDWTVGTRVGRDQLGNIWITDVQRFKMRPGERDDRIRQVVTADGRGVVQVIPQDPGQAGVSMADALVKMLAGFPVEVIRETGPKWTRAQPLASMAGRGMVKLIRGPWVSAFLDELEAFKEDESHGHDDQVDSASTGFNVLATKRRSTLPPRPRNSRAAPISY